MMNQFVLIATPSFERRPCIEYVISMLQTEKALSAAKIDHATTILGGDPYLGKVRNRLVSTFLTEWPMATDLFFIDDDVGWPEHKFMEFLRRPEDIIVGAYPKKQESLEFPVTLQLDPDGNMIEQNGLYLANLVPTGFMRIKRHVLERMSMECGKYHEVIPGGTISIFWNMFEASYRDLELEGLRTRDLDTLTKDEAIAYLRRAIGVTASTQVGQFWGEDYYFAQRWRDMGGQVWCDPDIQFTHRGSKAWEANFVNSVRATLQDIANKQRKEAA
jgi:hypothetical protein